MWIVFFHYYYIACLILTHCKYDQAWTEYMDFQSKISVAVLVNTGIILYVRPANDRQCYNVASSLIGWAYTQNDPCDYGQVLRLFPFSSHLVSVMTSHYLNQRWPSFGKSYVITRPQWVVGIGLTSSVITLFLSLQTKTLMGEVMKEASFSLAEAKFTMGDFNHLVIQNVNKAQIKVRSKFENVAGLYYILWNVLVAFHDLLQTLSLWRLVSLGLPSNLQYKAHQIPKLKCFLSSLAVVFAQSIEARC